VIMIHSLDALVINHLNVMIKLVQHLLLTAQQDYLVHKAIKLFVRMILVYKVQMNVNYLFNVMIIQSYVLINLVDLHFHNVQKKRLVNKVFHVVEMETVKSHVYKLKTMSN